MYLVFADLLSLHLVTFLMGFFFFNLETDFAVGAFWFSTLMMFFHNTRDLVGHENT